MAEEAAPGGTNWSYDQLDMSTSLAQGNWGKTSGSDVPEPTTGMLMLVGLAGLALRRRRA